MGSAKTAVYDAIVIGAGHNGLVTAAYLARAGLKVAVFEKRPIEGGCAVTQETWPGFKISSCAYVNSLFRPEIVSDLKLEQFGYEMLPRNPSSFTAFPDGRSLLLGPDQALCRLEIAKFSAPDAVAYPRYDAALTELAAILEPIMMMVPPNPSQPRFSDLAGGLTFAFRNRKLLKRRWPEIIRFLTGSAAAMLDQWFESDELKATLATDAIIGANASPSMPGTAYILFHHVMGSCNGVRGVWGYMRGGMGGLTQALARAGRALGVEIFTGAPVAQVQIRAGAVAGVTLSGGEEYRTRVAVSNADPNVTFNRLVESRHLPEEFVREVRRINYDSASVKINLALAELPNFKALPGSTPGPQHQGTIHICPAMQYIEEACADSIAGRPSRAPILECTIPSVVDSTLAPAGKHVMNIFAQYGPYRLKTGKTWDEEREPFADRCLAVLSEYAPNLRGAVLHREVLTPLDLEREYSLTGGNIFHGRLSLDQIFSMRPVPGFADYRTPLRGLYLCGSGAHPGGGVMGTPGLNAARMVIRDRIWK